MLIVCHWPTQKSVCVQNLGFHHSLKISFHCKALTPRAGKKGQPTLLRRIAGHSAVAGCPCLWCRTYWFGTCLQLKGKKRSLPLTGELLSLAPLLHLLVLLFGLEKNSSFAPLFNHMAWHWNLGESSVTSASLLILSILSTSWRNSSSKQRLSSWTACLHHCHHHHLLVCFSWWVRWLTPFLLRFMALLDAPQTWPHQIVHEKWWNLASGLTWYPLCKDSCNWILIPSCISCHPSRDHLGIFSIAHHFEPRNLVEFLDGFFLLCCREKLLRKSRLYGRLPANTTWETFLTFFLLETHSTTLWTKVGVFHWPSLSELWHHALSVTDGIVWDKPIRSLQLTFLLSGLNVVKFKYENSFFSFTILSISRVVGLLAGTWSEHGDKKVSRRE